jgi:succinate-acetate transporter protein
MSDRTDRLLAVLVILIALLVVSQTTVVPRNQLLGTIGVFVGAFAIVYALAELVMSLAEHL